jgi:outer membrane receptor protein involved in Fe transport
MIRSLAEAANDPIIDYLVGATPLPLLEITADEYSPTFEPEYVDAFELGMKNTLLDGGLTLNLTGFYYDYTDYQVSQIRDRTAVNENFDAQTWGLELETVFAPSERFQIIANIGYLGTRIGDGERSIDIMNRTQGDPNYTLVKPWLQLPSNCVVPTHVAEDFLQASPYVGGYWQICRGIGGLLGDPLGTPVPNDVDFGGTDYNVANYPELNGGAGLFADLSGNELPNAPHWTVNIGAQYSWDIFGEWTATVRGDAYWQSQSWARVYNSEPYDKLRGWYNANVSFAIANPDETLQLELYVKNALDDTPITGAFLNSDDTGLTTNVFVLDPRIIGLRLTRTF